MKTFGTRKAIELMRDGKIVFMLNQNNSISESYSWNPSTNLIVTGINSPEDDSSILLPIYTVFGTCTKFKTHKAYYRFITRDELVEHLKSYER